MLNYLILYIPMKEFLSILTFINLLEYRSHTMYKTTTKGIIYLQLDRQINTIIRTKFESSGNN